MFLYFWAFSTLMPLNLQVEATRRLIENYKKENKAVITKNKGRPSKEEEELEMLLEQEKEEAEERRRQAREEDREAERQRRDKKEALIDDLMFSDRYYLLTLDSTRYLGS